MATKKKKYIPVAQIAAVLGVSTKTARSWLRRERALRKIGARYYSTLELLLSAFPEAFQELAQ